MSEVEVGLKIKTKYLSGQSKPDEDYYVFAYTITITNQCPEVIQLLTREWTITDADGKVTEVSGEGVVGQQPMIGPGKSFSYTSGAVLKTPIGTMEGQYGIITLNDSNPVDIPIPCFRLAVPTLLH
ncbi:MULTISPECIES: Co2+/Mg2+ efflux protein ApaG [Gammaproteobacteria]|uniref:Co2+/Mg2+ efflux protein ApaG n=1 Tax=Gammaproteobacteria TaxID=1236 RepID=UPI000DCFBBBD|nr:MULTISPECIES: Co2+/Mg2+ efflux protein ApaG [Gammaproteobacteria]RTE85625.1 Co2+/Mg2+ efflux protein ApaG [Aliidiomarina sp. B3213]TCZ89594.1 Co2+/Mg2+ efflux protein ApaG [Lysobacter sp. N42]